MDVFGAALLSLIRNLTSKILNPWDVCCIFYNVMTGSFSVLGMYRVLYWWERWHVLIMLLFMGFTIN
jgi:hypothetical protein